MLESISFGSKRDCTTYRILDWFKAAAQLKVLVATASACRAKSTLGTCAVAVW